MIVVRAARPDDVPALTAIYAHHVLNGTGTFEEEPPGAPEMAARLARVTDGGRPWLVAEDTGNILGYAYAAQFRDRSAYRHAGETSVYVAPDHLGRGVGSLLLGTLIDTAAASGFRQLIAVIGDSGNEASIALHRRFGFTQVGLLSAVGLKFGRALDVVFMQRAV